MLAKYTEPEFPTVEGYVSAIIANRGNDSVIQNLILRAAKIGILPQLDKIEFDSKVFEETDIDIVKTSILDSLFRLQGDLLDEEKSRQKLHATRLYIEKHILEIKQTLNLRHLQDALEIKQSRISITEKSLKGLRVKQEQLILAAKQANLLPGEEHIDKYQPRNDLIPREKTSPEIRAEIKRLIQTPVISLMTEVESNFGQTLLSDIRTSVLKRRNCFEFKKNLKRNLCAILSRASEDKERQILITYLQFSDFQKVTNVSKGRAKQTKLIKNTDFRGADLSYANFKRACLRKADFTNANLQGANLSRVNLEGANFTNADLSYVKLKKGTEGTIQYEAGQLLLARSLVGIEMDYSTLKTKYTPEERNALWEKLCEDYEALFKTTNDPEAIIRAALDISPHTHSSESFFATSVFNRLDILLEKDSKVICEALLNLAYKRLVKLISEGARVSKETEKDLRCHRNADDCNYHYGDIFGKDTNTILEKISINSPCYECLDEINACFEILKNNPDNDEKIQATLPLIFEKINLLFSMNLGFVSHANKAFADFISELAELYGDDDAARNQTLISLFLSLIDGTSELSAQCLFHFADTLYKMSGKDIGFYAKDNNGKENEAGKWELILALLANAKDKDAREIQARVFNSLKKMNLKSGILSQSFEAILGVEHVFSHTDLCNLLLNLKTKWSILEANEFISQIKGKSIAIYEQAVLNPNQVEIIQWSDAGDSKSQVSFVEKLNVKAWKHRNALYTRKANLLSQLKNSIDKEQNTKEQVSENEMVAGGTDLSISFEQLINERSDLSTLNRFWWFFEKRRRENSCDDLSDTDPCYFKLSQKRFPPWLQQVDDILMVLNRYVELSKEIEEENKCLRFRMAISEILIHLNAVLESLDYTHSLRPDCIEDKTNIAGVFSNSFGLLSKAIENTEAILALMGVGGYEFIGKLSSQEIKRGSYDKAIQAAKESVSKLKAAQQGLYLMVLFTVITSIIVGCLVGLPYIAIPVGIMLLTLAVSEMTRRQKNNMEEKLEINIAGLSAMPENLSSYLTTDFAPAILLSASKPIFFKQANTPYFGDKRVDITPDLT